MDIVLYRKLFRLFNLSCLEKCWSHFRFLYRTISFYLSLYEATGLCPGKSLGDFRIVTCKQIFHNWGKFSAHHYICLLKVFPTYLRFNSRKLIFSLIFTLVSSSFAFAQSSGPTCSVEPGPINEFTIREKWRSNADVEVYQTPVVADLDGDGISEIIMLSNNSHDEEIRTSKDLHILSGIDGELIRTIETPVTGWTGTSRYAVIDLEGDGDGEIIFAAGNHNNTNVNRRKLFCYEHDGSPCTGWQFGAQLGMSDSRFGYRNGEQLPGVNIADFNVDGRPEIYVFNQIFDGLTGRKLAEGGQNTNKGVSDRMQNNNSFGVISSNIAIDMDGDDDLELVAGNQVFDVNITNSSGMAGNSVTVMDEISGTNIGDGLTAVADIDLDGKADAVVVRTLSNPGVFPARIGMYAWSPTSGLIGQDIVRVPNVGSASNLHSLPLVGDIDGDFEPEIVFVVAYKVLAYEYNPNTSSLELKWTLDSTDPSGATGITLFDFDDNGLAELVYRDEDNIRVIDGSGDTASDINSFPCFSGTDHDMPVIADINGDQTAEIIISCNDDTGRLCCSNNPKNGCSNDSPTGFLCREGTIRAYTSASDPWAPARGVWNQYAYNITGVDDDLTVATPQINNADVVDVSACQRPNTRPFNTFLQQQATLDENGCPVAPVSDPSIIVSTNCNGQSATLNVQAFVSNNSPNATMPPGYDVAFYNGDPEVAGASLIGVQKTSRSVAPLSSIEESFTLTNVSAVSPLDLYVVVNDNGLTPIPFNIAEDWPSGNSPECNYDNNKASAAAACGGIADLSVGIDGPSSIGKGETATYRLVVRNLRDSTAVDTVLNYTLPAGISVISVSGECSAGFPCSLGSLVGGQVKTFDVKVGIAAGYDSAHPFTVHTRVSTATLETTLVNNTAIHATAIYELQLLKTVIDGNNDGIAAPGESLTYIMTLRNLGSGSSPVQEVTDEIPEFTRYSPGSISGGRSSNDQANELSWTFDSIQPGAAEEFGFEVVIDQQLPGFVTKISNIAYVDGTTPSCDVKLLPDCKPTDIDTPENPGTEGPLRSPIYVKWNTFLNQWNFLELGVEGTEALEIEVFVYSLFGEIINQRTVVVNPNSQQDVDINDMVKKGCDEVAPEQCEEFEDLDDNGIVDSYGLVMIKFEYDDPSTKLVGRLSNYKQNDNLKTFDFAFARELQNPLRGRSLSVSNTSDPKYQGSWVPNWSEVISLSKKSEWFTVYLYNRAGEFVKKDRIQLEPLEERDVSAGHEEINPQTELPYESAYMVEVIPDNDKADYLFSVSRYSSSQPALVLAKDFNYAFSFAARNVFSDRNYLLASNEVFECGSVRNWIEVGNVSEKRAKVTATFFNHKGGRITAESEILEPKQQHHFYASEIIPAGETGVVVVESSIPRSIISQSTVYVVDCETSIADAAYSTPGKYGGFAGQTGSVNTFLEMTNELRLISIGDSTVELDSSLVTFKNEKFSFRPVLPRGGVGTITFSTNGDLQVESSRYAILSLTAPIHNSYVGEVLRQRLYQSATGRQKVDFVMPIDVK